MTMCFKQRADPIADTSCDIKATHKAKQLFYDQKSNFISICQHSNNINVQRLDFITTKFTDIKVALGVSPQFFFSFKTEY